MIRGQGTKKDSGLKAKTIDRSLKERVNRELENVGFVERKVISRENVLKGKIRDLLVLQMLHMTNSIQ